MAKSTRREFGKVLGALAVAGSAKALPVPASVAPPPPPDQSLAAVVRARYGTYLSEPEFKLVRRQLERMVSISERLKRFPLKNGDQPYFGQ
jgi:hypothetical protein